MKFDLLGLTIYIYSKYNKEEIHNYSSTLYWIY